MKKLPPKVNPITPAPPLDQLLVRTLGPHRAYYKGLRGHVLIATGRYFNRMLRKQTRG